MRRSVEWRGAARIEPDDDGCGAADPDVCSLRGSQIYNEFNTVGGLRRRIAHLWRWKAQVGGILRSCAEWDRSFSL